MRHTHTVFINGTFDIFHEGHLKLVRVTKSFKLPIVCSITSDDLVRAYKGRPPLFNQKHRADLLSEIIGAKCYIHNTEEELLATIYSCLPALHVKGSDYIGKPFTGSDCFEHTVYVDRSETGASTSALYSCLKLFDECT